MLASRCRALTAPFAASSSLVPATTEMLFAMGAGDRLVGVGNYDTYPPETRRLPKLGGLLDPDVERLLALKPDLVVVYRRSPSCGGSSTRPVSRRSFTCTVDSRTSRRRFGRSARELTRADGRINAWRIASRRSWPPSARASPAVRGRRRCSSSDAKLDRLRGVFASGGYGFLHDMLEIAGATDALADINARVGADEHRDDSRARRR